MRPQRQWRVKPSHKIPKMVKRAPVQLLSLTMRTHRKSGRCSSLQHHTKWAHSGRSPR